MNVDSYRRKEAIDKARGAGRPPTRATIIKTPRSPNCHADCRCIPIQIVALQIRRSDAELAAGTTYPSAYGVECCGRSNGVLLGPSRP